MINSIKSKVLFLSLVACCIGTTHTQGTQQSKLIKVTQLKKAIADMFTLFTKKHPELYEHEQKILTNLDQYGSQLSDTEMSKCYALIKRVTKINNYLHLAYNYSTFSVLEDELPKRTIK